MNDEPGVEVRAYPRSVSCGGTQVEIDALRDNDASALSAFVAALPAHDLLFLDRDLAHPKVIAAWMAAIIEGRVTSLAARVGGELIGCTAIVPETLWWSRHVGELRVLVAPAWRGRAIGQLLVQESFAQALALGLEKLFVRMTIDQRAAIAAFEGLGFRAEAVLRGHVKDHQGTAHDLAILSHHVHAVQARMQAYGMGEAPEN